MSEPKNAIPFRLFIVTLVVGSLVGVILAAGAIIAYENLTAGHASSAEEEADHVSLETQYDTAIHEAGHVIANRLRMPERAITEVWIYVDRPSGERTLGATLFASLCGSYQGDDCRRRDAVTDLAGMAAEEVILKRKPEFGESDSDNAGGQALALCEGSPAECGVCPEASKVGATCMLKGMMLANRARLYEQAKADIDVNKETVVALANALYRKPATGGKRKMTGAEIDAFLASHPLGEPAARKSR